MSGYLLLLPPGQGKAPETATEEVVRAPADASGPQEPAHTRCWEGYNPRLLGRTTKDLA